MADPTDYTPGYSFTGWQAINPTKPLPAPQVDTELADISESIGSLCGAVGDVRRSDGALHNGIVTVDSLSDTVRQMFALAGAVVRGTWTSLTAYAVGDLVQQGSALYFCVIGHTSDVFSADLAAGRWFYLNATSAAGLPVVPGGSLVSTDAQAAFLELDADLTTEVNARAAADATANGRLNTIEAAGWVTLARLANSVFTTRPLLSREAITDGACQVAQGATVTLSGSAQFGAVDMFSVRASGGTPSAGTITQGGVLTNARSGKSLSLTGATITGSGVVAARHRIEAIDAVKLANKSYSFQVRVQHDVGSAINYTLTLRKPTAADNYASTTTVHTSSAVSVPSATSTLLTFENIALGDVSNGLELDLTAACGAVTTKNFQWTDWQEDEGPICQAVRLMPFTQALIRNQRYLTKTFPYATAPATNASTAGALSVSSTGTNNLSVAFNWRFPVEMRIAPTSTIFNPANASNDIRNASATTNIAAIAAAVGTSGMSIFNNATTVANNLHYVHVLADARL